jgi:hypothetical protein
VFDYHTYFFFGLTNGGAWLAINHLPKQAFKLNDKQSKMTRRCAVFKKIHCYDRISVAKQQEAPVLLGCNYCM